MLHALYRSIFGRLFVLPVRCEDKATQTEITLEDSIVVVMSDLSW